MIASRTARGVSQNSRLGRDYRAIAPDAINSSACRQRRPLGEPEEVMDVRPLSRKQAEFVSKRLNRLFDELSEYAERRGYSNNELNILAMLITSTALSEMTKDQAKEVLQSIKLKADLLRETKPTTIGVAG